MDAGHRATVGRRVAEGDAEDAAFVPDYVMLDFGDDPAAGKEGPPRAEAPGDGSRGDA